MVSITCLLLSVISFITCVPVEVRENEEGGRNAVIIAAESAFQSVLRMDHHKCFLKFVCDVGANYSAYGNVAYKVASNLGYSMEPFDFNIVDQPLFLQLLDSTNPGMVDVVSLNKLNEETTTQLLSRNSPDDGLTGRHCAKFDKSLIYVKNQNGYFKSVSWKRVQSTTTPRPVVFKPVRQPVTKVLPQHEKPPTNHRQNQTQVVPTSTEKPTVPVPGIDFNQILRLIKELSDSFTNSGPKNLDDKATSASNSPILLPTVDQHTNLAGLANETAGSPANSTPVVPLHANLTGPVNATTHGSVVPVAILLELNNFSEDEASLDETTNSTDFKADFKANLENLDNATKEAPEDTDFSNFSNSTVESVVQKPEVDSDAQVNDAFEDSFLVNVTSDDTSVNNSSVLAEVKGSAVDQGNLEGRNDIYPGAFVFNRAFVLGLASGHASCKRTFRDCFMNSEQVIDFGSRMVTRLHANYHGSLID